MPRDIEITTWIEAAHFREWRNLLSRGNDQLQTGKSSNECDHVKAKKMNSTQSRRPRVQPPPQQKPERELFTSYIDKEPLGTHSCHISYEFLHTFLNFSPRLAKKLSDCDKAGSGRSINCPCNAIFTPYLKEFLCNGSSYKNKANARLLH